MFLLPRNVLTPLSSTRGPNPDAPPNVIATVSRDQVTGNVSRMKAAEWCSMSPRCGFRRTCRGQSVPDSGLLPPTAFQLRSPVVSRQHQCVGYPCGSDMTQTLYKYTTCRNVGYEISFYLLAPQLVSWITLIRRVLMLLQNMSYSEGF